MKLVVFDVDGTLIDSQALIVGAMGAAFESVGMPPADRSRVLSIVGLSLPLAVGRLAPEAAGAQQEAIVSAYRQAFMTRRIEEEAPLYPGASDCLEALSHRDDVLLGIATGKSRRGLDAMLDHRDLRRFFVTLQTADNHPSKPHPEMLLSACDEAGIDPADALMIGDTEYDIEMAKAAGTAAIGVSWGYHPAETLSGYDVPVADDFPMLLSMIGDWAA
ncbi:HAD-IA family hydrolase [Paracoccus aerodenitrificans]|uniref:HAD-IA family hydrolase n=1 Tax=Paracoccus aerodenitrificans TaxID=3017781 RepID=UPI0022F12453|nr:HAD-IA family hydrolase [Paracoccus aerodenitrificans]WBU64966.1 HAD-IA family hydrolase [Paracoccus aerodenitrificans]